MEYKNSHLARLNHLLSKNNDWFSFFEQIVKFLSAPIAKFHENLPLNQTKVQNCLQNSQPNTEAFTNFRAAPNHVVGSDGDAYVSYLCSNPLFQRLSRR